MLKNRIDRIVQLWLLVCCIMLLAMVWLGGITRLTNSGLSITEWRPVVGIIPPLNEYSWLKEKHKYELTPEFKYHNNMITLQEFKKIYLIEFTHRLIARLTCILLVLPFLYFLYKKKLDHYMILRMAAALFFIVLQGFIGWYMVKSGLVNQPYVSHYRLALHLLLALIIFYFYWTLFLYYSQRNKPMGFFRKNNNLKDYKIKSFLLNIISVLIVIQIILGALVAGLKAGLICDTYPLINGQFFPSEIFLADTTLINIFSNPGAVHFIHRIFPFLIFIVIVIVMLRYRNFYPIYWLLSCFIIQFVFGIMTILFHVPVVLASLHQVTAFILFAINIYVIHCK